MDRRQMYAELSAKAFNEGSDARIRGDRVGSNPYIGSTEQMQTQWRLGWMHVHRHWGIDAKGRKTPKLPDIKYG